MNMATSVVAIPIRSKVSGPAVVAKIQEQLVEREQAFLLKRQPTKKQVLAAQKTVGKGLVGLARIARIRAGLPRETGLDPRKGPWHEQVPEKKRAVLEAVEGIRNQVGLSRRFDYFLQEYVAFDRSLPQLIDPCPLHVDMDGATGEPRLFMQLFGDTTEAEVGRKWFFVRSFQAELSENIGREDGKEGQRAFWLGERFKALKEQGRVRPGESYKTLVVDVLNGEFRGKARTEHDVHMLAKRYHEKWTNGYM